MPHPTTLRAPTATAPNLTSTTLTRAAFEHYLGIATLAARSAEHLRDGVHGARAEAAGWLAALACRSHEVDRGICRQLRLDAVPVLTGSTAEVVRALAELAGRALDVLPEELTPDLDLRVARLY